MELILLEAVLRHMKEWEVILGNQRGFTMGKSFLENLADLNTLEVYRFDGCTVQ